MVQYWSGAQTIALREWVDLDERYEFRVFVFAGRVTAISQYMWDRAYEELQDAEKMRLWKEEIIEYWETRLKDKLTTVCKEWVVDVVRLEDATWKMIEINAFGADLRTGSCLFHWDLDYGIIHATDGDPQMRICVGGSQQAGFSASLQSKRPFSLRIGAFPARSRSASSCPWAPL